ncbi:MAG TPA: terpene cyclase/mutase family protein [Kiritimatiellia bacterium]|nr:terpene cyclase/mutase family protein [Kiritimatiellia bacterium]
MNDVSRAEELIQKYLDDIASAEELTELDQLLRRDRDAARLFARLGRMDSRLYGYFNACRARLGLAAEMAKENDPLNIDALRARWLWGRFLDHLWGPTGAILLHMLLLVVLIKFTMMNTTKPEAPAVQVVMEAEAPEHFDEFEKELAPFDEIPQEVPTVTPPESLFLAEKPAEADVQAPGNETDTKIDFAALNMDDSTKSALTMKGLYAGRTGGGRADALADYGGAWGRYTEMSVVRALEWLRKNQGTDGSWGPNKIAMTGLGLLTFLAHGETTSSDKYGQTVEKALRFLLTQQDEKGVFAQSSGQEGSDPAVYAHGIATYAVSEAYGLTRIPSLKPVMERAVQAILDGQQTAGGWNYRFSKTARRDTSVSGWMIQALKSALIAGAENSGIREALEKASADLKSAQNMETGRFGYTDPNTGSLGCTGIGVLCLQLLGHGAEKEARDGLQALREAKVEWDPARENAWPLYEWYYITQAKFHHGGQTWSSWNAEFARVYVKQQNEDGSWPAASKWESSYGPVYSTTLAALTLQVYYRMLPTYKPQVTRPEMRTNDVEIRVY